MLLNPSQVQEVAGISQETLRYWRNTLDPIKGRKGHQPCFTPSEALALRIIASLKDSGLVVSALVPAAPKLFADLGSADWAALEISRLHLNPKTSDVNIVPATRKATKDFADIVVIVPLREHVRAARRLLMGTVA